MMQGSIVALITPFDQRGNVDFETLQSLIEWHIESGTDGIVLCGSTGESSTLSHDETLRIFKEGVAAAAGRIPILAGTGSNDTAKAVRLTGEAKDLGVDGALVVFPYYNRPMAEGCYQHFQEISKIGLPLIPYHHPGRTGIKLPVKDLARILDLPSIIAVKEATADLDYALDLMHHTQTPVFSGDDTLALPLMASGAIGVISIVANIIPRQWKILTTLLLSDEVGEARDYYKRYHALVKTMVAETNPQCVKYALSAMGKCEARWRLPLTAPQDAVKEQIRRTLETVDKFDFVLFEAAERTD